MVKRNGELKLSGTSNIGGQQLLQIIVVSLGVFLSSLDVSLNVALPEISDHFGSSPETTYLMIIFYLGTTVGLQLSIGRAGDIYGLRKMFLLGLITYSFAMIAIGLSQNIEFAIGFRVLQAVGNSALLTISPALITGLVHSDFRGRALGIMAGVGSAGMIVGTLLSGVALQYLSWNWIFLGRLPVCLLAIVGVFFIVRETRQGLSRSNFLEQTFDIYSAILVFVTFAAFVFFLKIATIKGVGSTESIVILMTSLFFGVLFFRRQKTGLNPILDLNVVKNGAIIGGFLSNLFIYMGSFVNLFILPYYAGQLLQTSSFVLGVLLFLNAFSLSIFSPIGGYLSDRLGAGIIAVFGMVITGLALLSYLFLSAGSGSGEIAFRMVIVGIGMGLFQSSNLSLVMGSTSQESLGSGGAISSMSRNLGAVTGVIILGWLFSSLYASGSPDIEILKASSTAGSISSFMNAFHTAYFVAVVIIGLGFIASLVAWASFRNLQRKPAV